MTELVRCFEPTELNSEPEEQIHSKCLYNTIEPVNYFQSEFTNLNTSPLKTILDSKIQMFF
jgi:hypothetical protein